MAEEKRYLDYDGLAYLVEKLTNRIAAAGGTAQGAYVAYTEEDGCPRICKPSEWSSDLGTAQGAAVVAGGRVLLVALKEFDDYCWTEGTFLADKYTRNDEGLYLSDGCFTTTTRLYAQQDYAGKENTAAVYWVYPPGCDNEDEGAGYVRNCMQYNSTDVGAGKWWLPSLGELRLMSKFFTEINEVMDAAGGTRLTDGEYWSSTMYDQRNAWVMDELKAGYDEAHSLDKAEEGYRARPVSEWVWIE